MNNYPPEQIEKLVNVSRNIVKKLIPTGGEVNKPKIAKASLDVADVLVDIKTGAGFYNLVVYKGTISKPFVSFGVSFIEGSYELVDFRSKTEFEKTFACLEEVDLHLNLFFPKG